MNGFSSQQNDGFFGALALFTAILQVMDYSATMGISSNDDILRELREDMAELRRENREILKQLNELFSKHVVNKYPQN